MKNQRLLRWASVCCLFVLVSFLGYEAQGSRNGDEARADIVTIDVLSRFGALEEPPVEFFHDKHTEALEKAGKDCASCHLEDKDTGRMSIMFKRLADADAKSSKDEIKDTYHEQCIGCHEQTAAAGQASGPTGAQCRSCHSFEPRAESSRQPVVVDRALHFRHASDYENDPAKCGACHHSWDQAAGKIVPVTDPGKVEGACGYCHGDTPAPLAENAKVEVRSERQAVHAECVSCHVERAAKAQETGPFRCAGCHSPMNQLDIQRKNEEKTKGKDLRMQRKQPDVIFVSTGLEPEPGTDEAPRAMPPVAFDHKFHEGQVDTCQACHHQAMLSCQSCHTVDGKPRPDAPAMAKQGIQLAKAMHLSGSDLSCVGCHEKQQQKPQCAACHAQLPKGIKAGDESSCASCHKAPENADASAMMAIVTDAAGHETDPAAKAVADERAMPRMLPAVDDIPETVTIKALADEYEPAKLPHRKIVLALEKAVKDSRLAGAYHTDPTTLCQGCHHNSPASVKPPSCASCHAQPFSEAAPNRPGLKAAYHGQCMGCHTAMGIDQPEGAKAFGMDKPTPAATDCAGCHTKK